MSAASTVHDKAPLSDLLERVGTIGSIIGEHADAAEEAGHILDEVRATLANNGLFSLLVPQAHGGLDLFPQDYVRVIEEISKYDSSAGWVAMVFNTRTKELLFLEEPTVADLFAAGTTAIAGQGAAATGDAVRVPGGYRLSGKWAYASGVHHADFLVQSARLVVDGKPVLNEAGDAVTMLTMVELDDAKLLGGWDVLGLRGTGSVDYEIHDAFVPEERTAIDFLNSSFKWDEKSRRVGYPVWLVSGHIGVELGMGRRLLDELAEQATKRGPRGALTDSLVFRTDFSRAEAAYRSARAYVYSVLQEIQDHLDRGGESTVRQITELRMSLVHLHEVNADNAKQAFEYGGGSALRGGVIQRVMRDIFAAGQHIIASSRQYDDTTQELLSLVENPQWGVLHLNKGPSLHEESAA